MTEQSRDGRLWEDLWTRKILHYKNINIKIMDNKMGRSIIPYALRHNKDNRQR